MLAMTIVTMVTMTELEINYNYRHAHHVKIFHILQ